MTAIPGNTTNQIVAALLGATTAVSNLQQAIVNRNNQNRVTHTKLDRIVDGLKFIESKLYPSFMQMDDLQVKSISMGVNLNKFLSKNNTLLGKLGGGFFDNADELLENLSEGFRENTDTTMDLMSRLKATGQSTDLLRRVMGTVQLATDGSTGAMDRLVKSSNALKLTYGISSESLLRAIESVKPVIDQASLVGAGEQVADLTQSLKSIAGDKASAEIAKSINLLISPSFMEDRIRNGIGDATDKLLDPMISSKERLDLAVGFFRQIDSRISNLTKITDGYQKFERSYMIANSQGNSDNLIAAKNLLKVMEVNSGIQNKIGDFSDKSFESVQNFQKEVLNFLAYTQETVYPYIIKHIPALLAGRMSAGLVGGFARAIGAAGKGGFGGTLGGPIGIAIGAGVGLLVEYLPDILGKKTAKDKEMEAYQRRTAEATEAIRDKGKDKNDIQSKINPSTGIYNFIMANMRESMRRDNQKSRDNSSTQLINTLNNLNETMKEFRRGTLPENGKAR